MQILSEEEPVHSWRDLLLLKLLIKGASWRAHETTSKTPKKKNKRCSLRERLFRFLFCGRLRTAGCPARRRTAPTKLGFNLIFKECGVRVKPRLRILLGCPGAGSLTTAQEEKRRQSRWLRAAFVRAPCFSPTDSSLISLPVGASLVRPELLQSWPGRCGPEAVSRWLPSWLEKSAPGPVCWRGQNARSPACKRWRGAGPADLHSQNVICTAT
ncbi:uncharacterized protein [Saccopteryx leptura]|uniref:uncharacterized protein isoform X1 n=1 Tax=Saccopteryx leptura TaxID=249018 RepID=UPI00339CDB38